MALSPPLAARILEVRRDRNSGASAIAAAAVGVLMDAARTGETLAAAVALCRAQPSMAPIWTAALEALAGRESPDRLLHFSRRLQRAESAMVRFACGLLVERDRNPLRVVTISNSGAVRAVLHALAEAQPIQVSCAESRPALEGRRLAAALATRAIPVICYADGGLGHALDDADVVLVGADAVGPAGVINKSGTRMLAAAASTQGVPVYVTATREKFVMPPLWDRLTVRDEAPDEVWPDPPAGVRVRNPYFEPTPLHVLTGIICDIGVLGTDLVPQVCDSLQQDDALRRALDELARAIGAAP